jgi:hypothetical protein
VASFRDPARTFAPVEVIERLLEIREYYGNSPLLWVFSAEDLASYLDCFGFDIYSLTANPKTAAFETAARSAPLLPNGSRSHDSATAH